MAANHPRYLKARWRRLRKAWGGRCVVCGSRRRLEYAHLRPTRLSGRGRGSWQRLYDILRHSQDYVLLCWFCHLRHDGGGRLT